MACFMAKYFLTGAFSYAILTFQTFGPRGRAPAFPVHANPGALSFRQSHRVPLGARYVVFWRSIIICDTFRLRPCFLQSGRIRARASSICGTVSLSSLIIMLALHQVGLSLSPSSFYVFCLLSQSPWFNRPPGHWIRFDGHYLVSIPVLYYIYSTRSICHTFVTCSAFAPPELEAYATLRPATSQGRTTCSVDRGNPPRLNRHL